MTDSKKYSPIDKEELKAKLIDLATPINFSELISKGTIEKRGAWYKILNIKHLPKSASSKVSEIMTTRTGETLVKFRKPTKSIVKYAEMLHGRR